MRSYLSIGVALAALAVAGCDTVLPAGPPDNEALAGPIEDLSGAQLASHLVGDELFARVFAPADGLGPLFVAASCEGCHIGDGKGHEVTTLTRFGRFEGGLFSAMRAQGGPQLQHRAIDGYQAETVPAEATGVTQLMPPAVTGLGYLEAISDLTLLALADPTDADGDGISGVPNWIEAPDFPLDLAYLQDMGITTDANPVELANQTVGTGSGDTVPDPEVGSSELASVVFYLRTLKVPPRREQINGEVLEGEQIFEAIGCASCHVPRLTTGESDIAALSRVEIHPYTDLLMHDMGVGLDDGYTEGTALTSEWRTAPLWGIGLAADSQGGSARYLHDGRAGTLREAILLHGGEASVSSAAFETLSNAEAERLIRFLESL
ncbi:MAG: CxxC motif-containing protein (DUF1111 family) [Thalassolituus oleivorans]|jgi:CxxC motif-containing protein (DUF1111 family)